MEKLKGKIIVNGVDGNFGKAAADLILKELPPEKFIFTSPRPEILDDYKKMGVDVRFADYNNPDTLVKAFTGGERMLLISMPRIGQWRRRLQRNAVDAAKNAGVKTVIYTSSVGVGNTNCPAIVTIDHRDTENYLKASGLNYIIMRDCQYAEAMTLFAMPQAIRSGKWVINHGDGKMAFISRNDCVATAVALLLNKGKENTIYEVTGPELLTYPQVGQMAMEISGRTFEIIQMTDEEMFDMWLSMGVPPNTEGSMEGSPVPWSADDMTSYGRGIREGTMSTLSNDVEMLIGRKPRTMYELMKEASASWKL